MLALLVKTTHVVISIKNNTNEQTHTRLARLYNCWSRHGCIVYASVRRAVGPGIYIKLSSYYLLTVLLLHGPFLCKKKIYILCHTLSSKIGLDARQGLTLPGSTTPATTTTTTASSVNRIDSATRRSVSHAFAPKSDADEIPTPFVWFIGRNSFIVNIYTEVKLNIANFIYI